MGAAYLVLSIGFLARVVHGLDVHRHLAFQKSECGGQKQKITIFAGSSRHGGAHDFFLRERTSLLQAVCFFFAFIGVLMVKGFDGRVSGVDLTVSFVSVIFSSIAYNLVRVLKDFDDELVVILHFTAVTVPVIGPFAVMHWVWPSLLDWWFILVIGTFTMLAQFYMTVAYQKRPASEVAIYNYAGVFIALVMGYFFFSETYSMLSLFGMATIMVSVFASSRLQ